VSRWFIGKNEWSDKLMTPTEAAYMAGFVDGEGTIGIHRARRKENRFGYRLQPYLVISNTDVPVLEAIQQMCGNGRMLQQSNPQKPHHKMLYQIRFMPNQIRHILPQLRPYLRVKAKQADYVIEFLKINTSGRNKSPQQQDAELSIRDAVCGLNTRGVRVQ
jgi:hypothetical protein